MRPVKNAPDKSARGVAVSLLAGWILLLTSGGIDAFACDPDKISQVWIAPSEVRITIKGKKKVAGVVSCRASSSEQGRVLFSLLLVDEDLISGGEDSEDDLLDIEGIDGMVSAANAEVPIVAARSFTLRCLSRDAGMTYTVQGFERLGNVDDDFPRDEDENFHDSYEGQGCEPGPAADLGLKTYFGAVGNESPVVFPRGGPVPACCVQQVVSGDGRDILQDVFPIFLPTPEPVMLPVDDLPFFVKFVVKAGVAHLVFVEGAGGPLPEQVNVSRSNSSSVKGQGPIDPNGSSPITVSGSGSFVTVEGTVDPDGTVDASGKGTVAGFLNISVTLKGTLQGGMLNAEYAMGTDGGLPGGFPIVFDIEGAAPDFDAFWEEVAQELEDLAQQLAVFNSPQPIGGVDFNDSFIRLAGNLLVA